MSNHRLFSSTNILATLLTNLAFFTVFGYHFAKLSNYATPPASTSLVLGALAIWFKPGGAFSEVAASVIGDLADLPKAVQKIVKKEAGAHR